MTATGFPERLTDNVPAPDQGRIYLTPPVASTWLANGRPLDAGTVMILQSNAGHELYESVRPLAFGTGDGALKLTGGSNGWSGVTDGAGPGDLTANPASAISWGHDVAFRLGPFPVLQDRPDPLNPNSYLLRGIRVVLDVLNGSGTLHLYFALTSSSSPPDMGNVVYRDLTGVAGIVTKDLFAGAPIGGGTPVGCRKIPSGPGDLLGSQQSTPVLIWCWIGCKGTTGDAILSYSVYETRG